MDIPWQENYLGVQSQPDAHQGRKNPDAGKDWRQEENGTTEAAHEFEQPLGVGDGQGSLVCCSPWGYKELDTTEWLN